MTTKLPPITDPLDNTVPRVVVVDDSAPLRAAIAETLEEGGCNVVGRAMDGSMALRLVLEEDPDVLTLDLEMPRMDGFTFLRILQKTRNTPVIVITSDARPEAALMALELGARDFVVKPPRPSDFKSMRTQLLSRVRALAAANRKQQAPAWTPPPTSVSLPPSIGLVAIGCSTGGPRALRDLLARVKPPMAAPVVIAQHMPPGFTEAFADRLKRATALDVAEVREGEALRAGHIRIAPGGRHVRVDLLGGELVTSLTDAQASDRWVPSADVLLDSAARALGKRLLGIVLTGMGKDGSEGAKTMRSVGAPLWTESALTATVEGMPASAAAAHGAAERVPLDELAQLFVRVLELPRA